MEHLPLSDLPISPHEVETLTRSYISRSLINLSFRYSSLQSWKGRMDLVITELMLAVVTTVLCAPVVLLTARNLNLLPNHNDAIALFGIGFGASGVVFVGLNILLWGRSRQYQFLDRILDDIERYNDVIQAIQIFQDLKLSQPSAPPNPEQTAVLQALSITRESLVCALMTDQILRRNQRFLARRQELLENIERNLTTVQNLQLQSTPATEYQQFLKDALQISLNVRQEMTALNMANDHG